MTKWQTRREIVSSTQKKSAHSGGNRSERRAIKLYREYITDEEE